MGMLAKRSDNLFVLAGWRHTQILADRFWASFVKEYLPSLQTLQKWKLDGNHIAPTIVMVEVFR